MNTDGTVHTNDELDRVRKMLEVKINGNYTYNYS